MLRDGGIKTEEKKKSRTWEVTGILKDSLDEDLVAR